MTVKKRTAKRNLRKIPVLIQQRIEALPEDRFVVACAKKIPESDIVAGVYSHIGLAIKDNALNFLPEQKPAPEVGRFSKINSNGKEIVRKDLPKTTKTYSVEVPNFGDWSKGSHDVEWDREVYRREIFPPKNRTLTMQLLVEEQSETGRSFILKFGISGELNRKDTSLYQNTFRSDLFFNLNLLQECARDVDVFKTTASVEEYLQSVNVSWEILPPGSRDVVVSRILSSFRNPNQELRQKVLHRYNLLASLNPIAFIRGIGGFHRYFGAKFANDLIVFENLHQGNAIYVMYENWETLSKMSRTELLQHRELGFNRIIHQNDWESKLIRLINGGRHSSAAD